MNCQKGEREKGEGSSRKEKKKEKWANRVVHLKVGGTGETPSVAGGAEKVVGSWRGSFS